MYRISMMGLGKMGVPIARNLMERSSEVIGHPRQGSPGLAAGSVHEEVSGMSALSPGEPS
jgi:3-hydroxyisobutyrate dehydrogenase-like beta-hydroxyacid dehydrogenase